MPSVHFFKMRDEKDSIKIYRNSCWKSGLNCIRINFHCSDTELHPAGSWRY